MNSPHNVGRIGLDRIFESTTHYRLCGHMDYHIRTALRLLFREIFANASSWGHNISERKHLIFGTTMTHHATLREGNRQSRGGPSCSGVVYQPVRTETPDAVEALTGL